MLARNKKVNFKVRDKNAVTVLKLHGSINWQFVPDTCALEDPDSVEWLCGKEIFHTRDYIYADSRVSLGMRPFIVPPLASKRSAEIEFLKGIWGEAFNSLVEAQQVIIIGYSVPNYDLQARVLLSSMIPKPYIVVDPNPDVGSRYFSAINPRIEFHQEYFTKDTIKTLVLAKVLENIP